MFRPQPPLGEDFVPAIRPQRIADHGLVLGDDLAGRLRPIDRRRGDEDVLAAAPPENVQVAVKLGHPVGEEIRHHVEVHPLDAPADLIGLGNVRLDAMRPGGD